MKIYEKKSEFHRIYLISVDGLRAAALGLWNAPICRAHAIDTHDILKLYCIEHNQSLD